MKMSSDSTIRRNRRLTARVIGMALLALCAAVGMTLAGPAEAKKKKKKTQTAFAQQISPNATIPDVPASGPSTPLTSTITIGKKFKGKMIGDVNVTGIQITGSADGALDDLGLKITAPNGHTVRMLQPGFTEGTTLGPLTFDDDVPTEMCYFVAGCQWGPQTLNPPFVGTANLLYNGAAGSGPLAQLNGGPMKGTWTFTAWDQADPGQTSVLNSWGIRVTARKPVT
jgi:subtilisin-like proprotein convertase family protein